MSRYLAFETYQAHGGKADELTFGRLAFRAEAEIDRETLGRLRKDTAIPESVKRLMFELIGLYGNADATAEGYAAAPLSEGNDGYSVSYAAESVLTPEKVRKLAYWLCWLYLSEETNEAGEALLCRWA